MQEDHTEAKKIIESQIFKNLAPVEFENVALQIFRFQYQNNTVYREYVNTLGTDISNISNLAQIPFLPISFFKSRSVICGDEEKHNRVFYSSTTTSGIPSKHFVKDVNVYQNSFRKGVARFYGDLKSYCLLALLPSYLERGNSSLVYMTDALIKDSRNPDSGFYLHNFGDLAAKIKVNEAKGQKTILIGVTYALLKLAEDFPMELKNTIIIETGGMKGKREELTRQEVHKILSEAFQIENIHSEYGMTELLSQAYSKEKGIFQCVPWMRVVARDVYDPFHSGLVNENGALNIIDLANIYSCSFIATDDLGVVHQNGEFEVTGRLDSADIRGCNSMASEI